MNIPVKKLKNGFEIPVYGLGSWEVGGKNEKDFEFDDEGAVEVFKKTIDAGITHIDTAEAYADGFAEEIISRVINKVRRDKLFITSKVLPDNLGFNDLIKSAKMSLKRLRCGYLDLYLIHRPNPNIPLSETMEAMDYLVDQGIVKNIGVSNFSIENIIKAQQYAKHKIVTNQLHYNLIHREIEKTGVLKYCQDNKIIITAYTPVQKGLLSKNSSQLMKKICHKYQKSPSQIAINWLISQKNVVAIAKTSNFKHLLENLGALEWEMEKEDIELLRQKFPGQEFTSKSYIQDLRNNYK